ncbi:NmrA family protein [Ephemerocybe angulata]|uniref:NmrA family protein n=1 Tax=Ephemerocybe angulata TaxID=980116 RepID=A0A8H6M874_9AGAR|nr:NmrA family protein [Tulosesus angulatus]
MSTLITGGGSQTGLALAKLLLASGHPVLIASRSGLVPDGFSSVKFDWSDPSSYEAAFNAPGHDSIKYVYLQFVGVYDILPAAKPLIELAVKRGVKRFVLLSASGEGTEKGPNSFGTGAVHTYLDAQGLDYVVLRPTWFIENFLRIYGKGIKEHSVIQTTIPTGRIPFVGVDDIAQAAFDAIVNVEKLPNKEPILVGADLLSHPEVAEALTKSLGRTITHVTITKEELTKQYLAFGLPESFAEHLATVCEKAENGAEEEHLKDPRTIIGKVGTREWIEKHKEAFAAL